MDASQTMHSPIWLGARPALIPRLPRLSPIVDSRPVVKPRLFYAKEARDLIKQIRDEKEITYAKLAERMEVHGARIETRALINKINRGRFTFAFALQVLTALDVAVLKLPNVLGADRANPEHNGGWRPPAAKRSRGATGLPDPERSPDSSFEPPE